MEMLAEKRKEYLTAGYLVFLTTVPLTIVETSRFNNMTKLEYFLSYKAKMILGTLDIANKDPLI